MKKKLVLIFSMLLISILCFGCNSNSNNGETAGKDHSVNEGTDGYQAVIRFAVSSDLQYGESTSRSGVMPEDFLTRFEDFFDLSYSLYAKDKTYKGCDLIAHIGDLTDLGTTEQYDACKAVTDNAVKKGTEFLMTMGNHEYRSGESDETCVQTFNNYYGEEHRTVVVNGYYFITISADADIERGEGYSAETLNWLDSELKKAVESDTTGKKPIFVFTHYPPKDTVIGSQSDEWGWYEENLGNILKNYPQVINFAGHSHFPAEDPASFWQGEYTVVNTGTLAHTALYNTDTSQIPLTDKDEMFKLDGRFHYAVGLIVEVDTNETVMIRYFDVLTGEYVGETYTIEAGKKDYLSTERFADSTIYFDDNATITINSTDASKVNFTFDICAAEGLLANNYLFELVDANGNVEKTKYITYEYFDAEPSQQITSEINGLTPHTTYTLKIYGINPLYKSTVTDSSRKISEPLTIEFTTP